MVSDHSMKLISIDYCGYLIFSGSLLYQVNQKMMLTLTASIMYWFLKKPTEERSVASDSENGNSSETISNSSDDSASESSTEENGSR